MEGTVTSRQGLPISVPGDSDADDVLVTIPVVELNETEPGIAGSDSTPGPGFMNSVVSLFAAARLTSGRGLQSRERGLGGCQ